MWLPAGTGRKFLRGPRGTGFLWVRDTWDGGRGFTWADGARRFETWENSYVNIIGLGAAVQQALALCLDAIGDRTRALGERLREDLRQLPGVTTHDLGTHRCAIVTAKIAGRSGRVGGCRAPAEVLLQQATPRCADVPSVGHGTRRTR